MTAPLLNEDKLGFLALRIVSTLTGLYRFEGWRDFFNNSSQLIWIFLPVIAAGMLELFSVSEFDNVHLIWNGILFSILCAVKKISLKSTITGMDVIQIAIISGICGVYQVIASVWLSWSNCKYLVNDKAEQVLIYVLSWISVGISQLVLIRYIHGLNYRGYVSEPNTYYPVQNEWDSCTRAFYIMTILIFSYIQTLISRFLLPTVSLYYVIAFFPLVTMSGFLPRFDIFLLYLIEMFSYHCIGMGPFKNMKRCIVQLLSAGIALIVFWLIQEYSNGFFGVIFLALYSIVSSSSITLDFCFREQWLPLFGRIIVTGLLLGFSGPLNGIFPLLSLILITVMFVVSEIQQELVPSLCPILHNPLKLLFKKKAFIVNQLINSLACLNLFCIYSTPIIVTAWIASTYIPPSYQSFSTTDRFLSCVYSGMFLLRALRFTWVDIRKASLDIYISCIITSYFYGYFGLLGEYRILNTHLLFLVSFFGEVAFRFVSKMWFWLLSLLHFITSKKQVLSFWYVYLIPSILLSPISIIFSAFLNAPVMPLFGLPIFWMGFLRPQKMWPDVELKQSIGDEAKIYEAFCPFLLEAIAKSISKGRLFPLEPGVVFLARLESRILLIRCVERSIEEAQVVIMGAELEPTSCHSIEGTKLDSVLDYILSYNVGEWSWFNINFFNSVKPLDIVDVNAYSESKMVATGILDSKEALALIPIIFFKVLVYYLTLDLDFEALEIYKDPPIHYSVLANSWKKFPVRWLEYVQIRTENTNISKEDQDLMMIATSCYVLIMGIVSPSETTVNLSMHSIFELYRGNLPIVTHSDCRNWFLNQNREKLRKICLKSFRNAVKLTIDQAIQGEPQSLAEFFDILEEYRKNWLITVDISQVGHYDIWSGANTWADALSSKVPNLFSISRKSDGVISIRLLTKQLCSIKIAQMNGDAVKGIWANLVLEMLYITNDDNERYSIQAHETLLRNITIQLASPPFGYPIWMSNGTIKQCLIDKIVYSSNYKRITPGF